MVMKIRESRKNGPRKNGPRKNGPPRKMLPGKLVPGKMIPGKLVPGKLRNEKSWGGRRVSWCVCGMLGGDQSMKTQNPTTNPKLGNEPKTRQQTQNTETKNRGMSIEHRGVCVESSDVINL